MAHSPELTGLHPHTGHHGPGLEESSTVGAMAWMSDELIADTRRVWSVAYGRVLSVEEAVEILKNVRRYTEVVLQSKPEVGVP